MITIPDTPQARGCAIVDLILCHYLTKGEGGTVTDLVEFSGLSDEWVQKALKECGDVPRGMEKQGYLYLPQRETLRRVIVQSGARPCMPRRYDEEGNATAW